MMDITNSIELGLARRNLNILRAELAGFGPVDPKNELEVAIKFKFETKINNLETDILNYLEENSLI